MTPSPLLFLLNIGDLRSVVPETVKVALFAIDVSFVNSYRNSLAAEKAFRNDWSPSSQNGAPPRKWSKTLISVKWCSSPQTPTRRMATHNNGQQHLLSPWSALIIKIFPSIILPTASRFRRPTASSNFGKAIDRHEVHGGLQLSQLCFVFLHESFSLFEEIAAHKQLVAENERVFHKTRLAGCTKRYGSVIKLLFICFFQISLESYFCNISSI